MAKVTYCLLPFSNPCDPGMTGNSGVTSFFFFLQFVILIERCQVRKRDEKMRDKEPSSYSKPVDKRRDECRKEDGDPFLILFGQLCVRLSFF